MSMVQQLIEAAKTDWEAYIYHPFVNRLADGTLPESCFQHYLKQDYLYLFHYSRALSLGIFKADNFEHIQYAHQANDLLLKEIQLHIAFCRQWGISEQALMNEAESPACVAYTRYVLDCGVKGGLAELYTALAPCMLGYAAIGKRLAGITTAHNPYQAWIDTYAGEDFQQAAADFARRLDSFCAELSDTRRRQLRTVFSTATRMEAAFWQMGLDLS